MESKNNFLVTILDYIRELFEHMSPSLFALMATLLPYLSPLPIAIFTASNATNYLGFSPAVSGIFVFVLEALGLWVTSVLVDSVIEFIRSRNAKTGVMILVFGGVTAVYISILINLNVNLEISDTTKTITPVYTRIITLISFIPLLTGFMNGWHKAKLDNKKETERLKIENQTQEDRQAEANHRRQMEIEKLKSDERIAKAQARASKSASNQLQTNRVFEASTPNSTSNPSGEAKKATNFEAAVEIIEAYLKQNNHLPKTDVLMTEMNIGQTNAYYHMVRYIVSNGEALLQHGLIDQARLDKANAAFEKMPRGKK